MAPFDGSTVGSGGIYNVEERELTDAGVSYSADTDEEPASEGPVDVDLVGDSRAPDV